MGFFSHYLPNSTTEADRQTLGNEIVRFIKGRTRNGLDKNNRPFEAYSDTYISSFDFKIAGKSRVNLTLTGEMLNTLEVISTGTGFIKIGFRDTDSNDKASFNRQHGREFLGITQGDLDLLVVNFTSRTEGERSRADIAEGIASSFLRGLFLTKN